MNYDFVLGRGGEGERRRRKKGRKKEERKGKGREGGRDGESGGERVCLTGERQPHSDLTPLPPSPREPQVSFYEI